MTEERLVLAELLEKAGDGDFLRAVAEAMFGRLFPKHRTLLQTADIARPAECAATNFIERQEE